jgi:thiol-disulfide isomerase/thioredoxin
VRRMLAAGAAALLLGATLAGCGADPLAEQYRAGSGKDYIAGDGTVETYAAANRKTPDEFASETDSGSAIASADLGGEVAVLNFWYAGCPPCRAEAPQLEKLNQEFQADRVRFLGVNTRDEAGTAAAFAKTFGLTYPSLIDYRDAAVQLAFSAAIPPNAVPTTLVLDRQGRIAARILGEVTEPSTLETIIRDTVAEKG